MQARTHARTQFSSVCILRCLKEFPKPIKFRVRLSCLWFLFVITQAVHSTLLVTIYKQQRQKNMLRL